MRGFARRAILAVTVLLALGYIGPLGADEHHRADWLEPETLPDLSFLNHRPAGKFGRVRANGQDLIYGDGSVARFWGVNLQAYAIFRTSDAGIQTHARWLAKLGVNLVRIHHHDSRWVRPNVFGDRAKDTLTLSSASLDRLDRWIAALKSEGIYIWLDLEVGRRFTAEDRIMHFAEMQGDKGVADPRGFNYINRDLQDRMLAFNRAYLGHFNPHTGFAYKDDPAIIAVLLSNENDLTHHFGNRLLPDKAVPWHTERYMNLAAQFATEHGLDPDRTWRSWTHGPAKLFLNDLENRLNTLLIADIRALGFDGLIATTNFWGGMPMSGLPALSAGDIIDVHGYGAIGQNRGNPRTQHDMFSYIASAQLAGKPLSISEWNVSPFPAPERFVAPLRMAALASLQGWDAPTLYGYSQQVLDNRGFPSNWSAFNDPALMTMISSAALMYRRGDVSPARNTYVFAPEPGKLFNAAMGAPHSIAIRTLTERSRLLVQLPETPQLPWLQSQDLLPAAEVFTDPNEIYGETDGSIQSDTGEIVRDPVAGIVTVDTARTQLVAGQIEGQKIALSDISVHLTNAPAAVVVQSLDGAPITQADEILISIAMVSLPIEARKLPFLTVPVRGEISIEAAKTLRLAEVKGVRHRWDAGRHVITFDNADGTQWLRLSGP